ncbi:MAG: glutamate--cysteine ligase [Planctomycetes bacterium]|nr:glutamate--cysteine ligase [Planctomycetota bacterium]
MIVEASQRPQVGVPRTADEVTALLSAAGRGSEARLLVGDEVELAVLRAADLAPARYEGEDGIGALLEALQREGGYAAVREAGTLIGLEHDDGHRLSLEPGGQLELSTAPQPGVVALEAAARARLGRLAAVADALGLWLVAGGMVPARQDDVPWMPKGRYRIMRAYFQGLGDAGRLAHHMMRRTLSDQVTIDYRDGDDARDLLRLGYLLAPVTAAVFASTPLDGGEERGLLSFRAEIWRFVDPSRQGEPPGIVEAADPLRAYVEWALDAPMMFRVVDGEYQAMHGASFRRVLEVGAWADGAPLTTADVWVHLNSVFPDVRLKRGLVELRAIDGQAPGDVVGSAALLCGLLYDAEARAAVRDLLGDVDAAAREKARVEVPRRGLGAAYGRRSMLEVARALVDVARAGLARRAAAGLRRPARRTSSRRSSSTPPRAGRTPAEDLLDAWRGPWAGDRRAWASALRVRPASA